MNVVSHNIANANTEGYSRQEISFSGRPGLQNIENIIGQGVDAGRVRQRQAEFADRRIRSEMGLLGHSETSRRILEQIETLFAGVGESDLNAVMNKFFNSWEDLSSNPESMEFRAQVIQKARTLVDKFHSMASGMNEVRKNINFEIGSSVKDVNRILSQIYDLNETIEYAESNGNTANDLRDSRNLLLKELSKKMDVDVQETSAGAVQVSYDGIILLDRRSLTELDATTVSDGTQSSTKIIASGHELTVTGGEIGGLLQVRDSYLTGYTNTIDDIASSLVDNVNSHHSLGFDLNGDTDINFFNPNVTNADSIEINLDILNDASKIATAEGAHDWVNNVHTSNGPGDNTIARRIANLRDIKVLQDRSTTFSDYYNSLYADVGFDTVDSQQNEENHQLLVDQLENYRDSTVGVSVDEEMADMMKFQHSYTAAARLVSVANEMMTTLINLVG